MSMESISIHAKTAEDLVSVSMESISIHAKTVEDLVSVIMEIRSINANWDVVILGYAVMVDRRTNVKTVVRGSLDHSFRLPNLS